LLSLARHPVLRPLPSFPTRRSSDLAPTDLPELLRRRFVSRGGQALALFVVPRGNPWLGSVAERFTADVESVDPTASGLAIQTHIDRKSTRLNSSHVKISYAVFCLKK